jgi:alpha-L-fucosidase
LREVGAWLAVNGEAIYGTRTWTKFGEGPTKVAGGSFHDTDTVGYTAEDFRFTTKGSALYAIELGWPAGGEAVIRSLGAEVDGKVASVSLLGSSEKISFEQRGDGLHLRLPASAPTGGKIAVAYRITFEGGKLPAVAAATGGAAK